MAELVIGAIGLVALESTVGDWFSKAATWQYYGKDFEQYSLSLQMSGIAYQRWRRSVKLVEGSIQTESEGKTVASSKETSIVVNLLGIIERDFQEAERTTVRYETDDMEALPGLETALNSMDLAARAKAVNKARQGTATSLQKARWVFRDANKLRELQQNVSSNVDRLIKVFPSVTQEVQASLVLNDLAEVVPAPSPNASHVLRDAERRDLSAIHEAVAAADGDSVMTKAMNDSISEIGYRHEFLRNVAEEKTKSFYGDELYGQTGQIVSKSRYVENVLRGEAKSQYGNRYNPPKSFWDD